MSRYVIKKTCVIAIIFTFIVNTIKPCALSANMGDSCLSSPLIVSDCKINSDGFIKNTAIDKNSVKQDYGEMLDGILSKVSRGEIRNDSFATKDLAKFEGMKNISISYAQAPLFMRALIRMTSLLESLGSDIIAIYPNEKIECIINNDKMGESQSALLKQVMNGNKEGVFIDFIRFMMTQDGSIVLTGYVGSREMQQNYELLETGSEDVAREGSAIPGMVSITVGSVRELSNLNNNDYIDVKDVLRNINALLREDYSSLLLYGNELKRVLVNSNVSSRSVTAEEVDIDGISLDSALPSDILSLEVSPHSNYTYHDYSPPDALRILCDALYAEGRVPYSYSQLERSDDGSIIDFNDRAREILLELRQMMDKFKRDNFGPVEFFNDTISNAYVSLYSHIFGTDQQFIEQLGGLAGRIGHGGYFKTGAFPGDDGNVNIDDYGMAGKYRFVGDIKGVPTGKLVRCADALSRVMYSKTTPGPKDGMFCIRISDADEGIYLNKNKNELVVYRGLLSRSRDEQEEAFSKAKGMQPLNLTKAVAAPSVAVEANTDSSLLVVSLAMSQPGRARDYLHHKFNYRIEAFCDALTQEGLKVTYAPYERPDDISDIFDLIHDRKVNIILFSLYQLQYSELEQLHQAVKAIKKQYPHITIMLEGPITNYAKQMISISPDIDGFIKGEADNIIKDVLLAGGLRSTTSDQVAQYIIDKHLGGLVLKTTTSVYISNLNRMNMNFNISMIPPDRTMQTQWFCERGCPNLCNFCRKDNGSMQFKRIIGADERIEWMISRLSLELDGSVAYSASQLKKLLRNMANDPAHTLRDDGVPLKSDTFIGKERVEIVFLSENALATRDVMMEYFRKVKKYGLQKYFKIKLADCVLSSLVDKKTGQADLEYIRAIYDAGVYFIGFGTESLLKKFLSAYNKGVSAEEESAYSADQVFAVCEALKEVGFLPDQIRHNIMSNYPNANIRDVKANHLMWYVAPIMNSEIGYFANGYGNARNPRVFAVEGSLFTAIDAMRYSSLMHHVDDASVKKIDSVRISDDFIYSEDTPEYMIRKELQPLRYVDERVIRLSSLYGYPEFSRNRVKSVLRKYYHDDDVKHLRDMCGSADESKEARALGAIIDIYSDYYTQDVPLLEQLIILKYHLYACGISSYVKYLSLLQEYSSFLQTLDEMGVSDIMERSDMFAQPGLFQPYYVLSLQYKAKSLASMVISAVDQHRTDASTLQELLVYSISSRKKIEHAGSSEVMNMLNDAASNIRKMNHVNLVELMAYPEQQRYEYIKHLFPCENDNSIYMRIVAVMNKHKVYFEGAIRILVEEQLKKYLATLGSDAYSRYNMMVKEYGNADLFGHSGLIKQLNGKDPERLMDIIYQLGETYGSTSDDLLRIAIVSALESFAAHTSCTASFIIMQSNEFVRKMSDAIDNVPQDTVVAFPRGVLVFIADDIGNRGRSNILSKYVRKPALLKPHDLESIYESPDWAGLYVDENKVVMRMAFETDPNFLKKYSQKLRFEDNQEMFARYLNEYAQYADRSVIFVMSEIRKFFSKAGSRPYSRSYLLQEEIMFYMNRLTALLKDQYPDSTVLMMPRGMEPFMIAWMAMTSLSDEASMIDRVKYPYIFRTVSRRNGKKLGLVSSSILSLLSESERRVIVPAETLAQIHDVIMKQGIENIVDRHLKEIMHYEGGLSALMKETKLSVEDLVIMIGDCGVDKRFKEFYDLTRAMEPFIKKIPGSMIREGCYYDYEEVFQHVSNSEVYRRSHTPDQMKLMLDVIEKYFSENGHLYVDQRELMYDYTRIFGFSDSVAMFKNSMDHSVRDALNLLLANTDIAQQIDGKSIACVDETSISGTSMLITELVLRSFSEFDTFSTINVSQRTTDTKNELLDKGVIDHILTSGLWCQEDLNSLFYGVILSNSHGERKYYNYSELIDKLDTLQNAITPEWLSYQKDDRLNLLNSKIDDYFYNNPDIFMQVNEYDQLRYGPKEFKRELLKLKMREMDNDPLINALQESIVVDDESKIVQVNEMNYTAQYLSNKLIIGSQQFKNLIVPEDLIEMDKDIRYYDLQRKLLHYRDVRIREAEQLVEKLYDMVGKPYMSLDSSGVVDEERLEHSFRSTYSYMPIRAYASKKTIYFSHDGDMLFEIYEKLDGEKSLKFLSAQGVVESFMSTDKSVQDAALNAYKQVITMKERLDAFLEDCKKLAAKYDEFGEFYDAVVVLQNRYQSLIDAKIELYDELYLVAA
jgi:hypothetical protein